MRHDFERRERQLAAGRGQPPDSGLPRGRLLRRVAVGAGDGTVAIYPLEPTFISDVPRSLKLHGGFVATVAWSPDGTKVLSTSNDGGVRVWNPDTFEVSQEF